MQIPTQTPLKIDDIDDSRLAPYADLKGTGPTRGRFIAEGRLPVRRLLESDYKVESLVIEEGKEEEFADRLGPETQLYVLSRENLKCLVGFDFHRGVLACGQRKPMRRCEELQQPNDPWAIALAIVGVSELENVGSLLRSAAALGVKHVLIGPRTADPFSRRVIRVSMANLFQLHFYTLDDPETQIEQLSHRLSARTIATTLDPTANSLDHFVADGRPSVLIVGNEATGLDTALMARATDRVRIAMQSGVDSLNVAVAGAVCMYALTTQSCKQRQRSEP